MMANPATIDGPEPVLLTGLILTALMPATVPSQRSGYPKLFRCPSVVAQPTEPAGIAPGCREWRSNELARIGALPTDLRIARVDALRTRIGVAPGEGLRVGPDGAFYDMGKDRIEVR